MTNRTKNAGAAVAAAAGAALAAAGVAAARWARARDAHPLWTMAGPALVQTVEDEAGGAVRVLRVGGVYQSATYLDERRFEPVFAYYRAFDRVFDVRPDARDVLMLGGGGCSWPKHVVTSRAGVQMDVVEIDPAIVRAARRWFFVDEACAHAAAGSSLNLQVADARVWLEHTGKRYDAVVSDCFAGVQPVRALATVEAARAAKRVLRPGGVYAANVVSRAEGRDVSFLQDVVATLRAVFAHVHVVPCADEDFGGEENYLVMATDAPACVADVIPYDDGFPGSVLRD